MIAEIEKEKPAITTLLKSFSKVARPKGKAAAKNSKTSTKNPKTSATKTPSKSPKLLRRDECEVAVDNIYTHIAAMRTALEKLNVDDRDIEYYNGEVKRFFNRYQQQRNAQWEPNPAAGKSIIDLLSSRLFLLVINII